MHFLYAAAFYFIPLGRALYNGYSIITAIFNWFLCVICLIEAETRDLLLPKKWLHIFYQGWGRPHIYLFRLLHDWFLTTKRHPSNAQSSYIPNSSLFQATAYPVGVSKVRSLYAQINVCISVKLLCVVTKIGARICLYTPYQCTKFQQDQSTHLRVRADFVICAKIRIRRRKKNKEQNLKIWSCVSWSSVMLLSKEWWVRTLMINNCGVIALCY